MTEREEGKLMEQVQSGRIKMRPRSYFFIKAILQLSGLAAVLLLAVFLASYLFFQLKTSGAFGLTGFGILGVRDLLLSLPWLILAVVIFFTVLLLWFAENYAVSYRNPLLYSALGVLLIVFVGGYLVAKTPLHPYFFSANSRPGGPHGMMKKFYADAPPMPHNAVLGRVESLEEPVILIRTLSGRLYQVVLSVDTRILPRNYMLEIGDVVLVHGRLSSKGVEAWGIKKFENNEINCPPVCNMK